jgi:hypothetical protein
VRRLLAGAAASLALASAGAGAAYAAFPYAPGSADPTDFSTYKLPDSEERPDDLTEKRVWMYAATEEPGNEPTNSSPFELEGIRGAHLVDADTSVPTAWETTTGRPDVTIAVLDSGIKWNDRGAMEDLREKTRIDTREAPTPQTGRPTPLEDGVDCGGYENEPADHDSNGDGVFNVVDYACDPRVERDPDARAARGQPRGVGPADLLDPQDVLIAFSDGVDNGSNGYVDDMVGWDFLDNDNDPYDDVQYGHGTGEARDSTAEADNAAAGEELGTCPNCTAIHMRVGDSFIADVNRFAQAVVYAVDNDALVVQEALGTLNNSSFARQAVSYAYNHGVTIIASAADEAAQHHNWPSSYPHVIVVNSVEKYDEEITPPAGPGRSYLQFNGCTNFYANVTVAIPSVSCSSDATGRAAGMAGLIYSAAKNAGGHNPNCHRAAGLGDCAVSANEVRQLMASGTFGGQQQADDVNFLSTGSSPEPSCNPPAPGCNDPNSLTPAITANRPVFMVPPNSRSYPARRGHDQFYGYGRVNMRRAVEATAGGLMPPEVEILNLDWWDQVPNTQQVLEVRAQLAVRDGTYTCRVLVAPGSYPNNSEAPAGDFEQVESDWCDGQTARGSAHDVKVADLDVQALKSRFPPNAGDFQGREPGVGTEQTSNGRPNTEPYGFVVKVVAERAVGGQTITGQDRRNLHLHRDRDMLQNFPMRLVDDGAASPLFVDVDGDNTNELVVATSRGEVHAFRRDGSELPGWPVQGDPMELQTGGPGFHHGLPADARGAFLASPAAADIDRDGAPEIFAADLEGKVYGWNSAGERVFEERTNLAYSGKPLSPFVDVRKGKRSRTQRGFIASPVLANLDDDAQLEVVAAAMDRHVYAWDTDGSAMAGYPVLVVDRTKVASIDPQTHALTFKPTAGDELNQGSIIDTPAVGDIDGEPGPEIVVGTNEEYRGGDEGDPNMPDLSPFGPLEQADILSPANSRLFAIEPGGEPGGPQLDSDPYLDGWPVKIAYLLAETLPVVGEGITGSPAIGPVTCAPPGGAGPKVAASAAAGPAYLLNPDGSSCYGSQNEKHRTAQSEGSANPSVTDTPSIPAFGHPAFGNFGEGMSFAMPATGVIRALDVGLNEYQVGGQDQVAVWTASSGTYRPGFPARVNDLQFLTGPAVADLDGLPGQEMLAGTASLDLAAFNAAGQSLGPDWPKLTSDWMVAVPLAGSFGTVDTEEDATKAIVAVTRSGLLHAYGADAPACSPASWPRFHHDNANSGDERRDAVSPGRPFDPVLDGGSLFFRAPGDDLLCGKAGAYEIVHSDQPITGGNFAAAEPLSVNLAPAEPGTRQTIALPAGTKRYVGIRARDEEGEDGLTNVGRPLVVDRQAPGGDGAGGGGAGSYRLPRARCSRPGRGPRGRRLGPVRLGQSRTSVRRLPGARRTRRRMDRICLAGGRAIRVGYRRGRAVLILSSSRRHGAFGLRPGSGARKLRGRARRIRVGPNTWYLRRGRRATLVFKVRRGRVREVGLASSRPSHGRRGARRFLRSFEKFVKS